MRKIIRKYNKDGKHKAEPDKAGQDESGKAKEDAVQGNASVGDDHDRSVPGGGQLQTALQKDEENVEERRKKNRAAQLTIDASIQQAEGDGGG